MSSIKSFEDLDVWKVGRQIRGELYALTVGLPKQEQYCLCQQVRTAAISLTANIAEGIKRTSNFAALPVDRPMSFWTT